MERIDEDKGGLVYKLSDHETEKDTRMWVHILSISYTMFRFSVFILINSWMLNVECSEHEIRLLKALNDKVNRPNQEEIPKYKVKEYKKVIAPVEERILAHFNSTKRHQILFRKIFDFFKKIGVKFGASDEEVEIMIDLHDLSKFTHKECLGFGLKWYNCSQKKLRLTTHELKEWNLALDHHHSHNPHHAEYHYPKKDNGEIDQDNWKPIVKTVERLKMIFLEIAVNDLTYLIENNYCGKAKLEVKDWLTPNETCLQKFHPTDREELKLVYKKFEDAFRNYVNDKQENLNVLHASFRNEQPLAWGSLVSEQIPGKKKK